MNEARWMVSGTMGYKGIGGVDGFEMVINARGRRAIPLIFSPDVHTTPLSQRLQRTHPGMGNGYGRHSNVISQLARGGGGVTSHGSNIAGWQTPPNSVTRLVFLD